MLGSPLLVHQFMSVYLEAIYRVDDECSHGQEDISDRNESIEEAVVGIFLEGSEELTWSGLLNPFFNHLICIQPSSYDTRPVLCLHDG